MEGIVEGGGEWLRISEKIFLPMKVGLWGSKNRGRGSLLPKWMVKIGEKSITIMEKPLFFNGMIWGYHDFWKHPYLKMVGRDGDGWNSRLVFTLSFTSTCNWDLLCTGKIIIGIVS